MDLLTPNVGLIFWQLIVFVILFIVLAKYAWIPITDALRKREGQIQDALEASMIAKQEMEQIKLDQEYLLNEAKIEREQIIKSATEVANKIKEDAKIETSKITSKMLQDAKIVIETEKKEAVKELKNMVAEVSISIAEKLLREKLKDNDAQKQLVEKFIKESNIN